MIGEFVTDGPIKCQLVQAIEGGHFVRLGHSNGYDAVTGDVGIKSRAFYARLDIRLRLSRGRLRPENFIAFDDCRRFQQDIIGDFREGNH